MKIALIAIVAGLWAQTAFSQGVTLTTDIDDDMTKEELRQEFGLSDGGLLDSQLADLFTLYTNCSPISATIVYVDSTGEQNEVTLSVAQSALQQMVVDRLLQAGLYATEEGAPYLFITVQLWDGLVDIDVNFNKFLFDEYTEQTRSAATWIDGVFGSYNSDLLFVHENTSEVIDAFIAEYLRINGNACNSL